MKRKDWLDWIEALESGEYKQTQGFLCRRNRFCCLGVAYDTLVEGDWEYKTDRFDGGAYAIRDDFTLSTGVETVDWDSAQLPDWVLDAIGLHTDWAQNLMAVNDAAAPNRVSFAQIAAGLRKVGHKALGEAPTEELLTKFLDAAGVPRNSYVWKDVLA